MCSKPSAPSRSMRLIAAHGFGVTSLRMNCHDIEDRRTTKTNAYTGDFGGQLAAIPDGAT